MDEKWFMNNFSDFTVKRSRPPPLTQILWQVRFVQTLRNFVLCPMNWTFNTSTTIFGFLFLWCGCYMGPMGPMGMSTVRTAQPAALRMKLPWSKSMLASPRWKPPTSGISAPRLWTLYRTQNWSIMVAWSKQKWNQRNCNQQFDDKESHQKKQELHELQSFVFLFSRKVAVAHRLPEFHVLLVDMV